MLLSGYVSSNGTGQDIEPELIQAGGRKDYIFLGVKIFAQLAETVFTYRLFYMLWYRRHLDRNSVTKKILIAWPC